MGTNVDFIDGFLFDEVAIMDVSRPTTEEVLLRYICHVRLSLLCSLNPFFRPHRIYNNIIKAFLHSEIVRFRTFATANIGILRYQ